MKTKTADKLIILGIIELFLLIFTCSNKISSASIPEIRATDYSLQVRLNTKKNQLSEKVTMQVENNTDATVKQLLIQNVAAGVLKYDRVHFKKHNKDVAVKINSVTSQGKSLSYKEEKDKSNLYINLTDGIEPGSKQKVTIALTSDIPYRRDRFGYQHVNGGKVYNLSFCFPYLSDYRDGKWNAHPYSDKGENRNSAISNYHVSFSAPKSYRVAASGKNKTKNGKTVVEAKRIRDLAIVASNRFKINHAKVDGITINNYYFAGKRASQYKKLASQTAIDSLKFFNKKLGKYPYHEIDVTAFPFSSDVGGMEYSGLIMVSAQGFIGKKKPYIFEYKQLYESVAHEVAHQWFFSTVGTDEYREPWLDEGMAEFFENYSFNLTKSKSRSMCYKMEGIKYTAKLHRFLNKTFNNEMKAMIRKNKGEIINYPMNQIPKGKSEGVLDYEVAEDFYGQLLVAMGKSKFYRAMREYYHTYYLKQTTGKEFLELIRKYDNSPKVNKIIKRYIDVRYL